MTLADRIQYALIGAVVGAIIGPISGAVSGFLLMAFTLFMQGQIYPQARTDVLVVAGLFAVLVAPLAAALSVMVGALVGGVSGLFPARTAAGAFGGFVGAFLGTFVSLGIFGGESGDILSAIVGLLTLAVSGAMVGVAVKYLELRRNTADTAGQS
jgi:hypothetical protein